MLPHRSTRTTRSSAIAGEALPAGPKIALHFECARYGLPMTVHRTTSASYVRARIGAGLIDGAVLLAGFLVLVAVCGAIFGVESVKSADGTGNAALLVTTLALLMFYPTVLTARRGTANGQTFGKQACDLRVVHRDGRPLTWKDAFIREGVFKTAVPVATLGLWLVADVLCAFGKRRQTLHDRVSRTMLVREDYADVPWMAPGAVLPAPVLNDPDPVGVPDGAAPVEKLELGQRAYIEMSAIGVDSERGCWIDPDAATYSLDQAAPFALAVELREGGLAAQVPFSGMPWFFGEEPPAEFEGADWLPITEVL